MFFLCYTPDQGAVHVSVLSPRQDQVFVIIKDTGIGISNEDLPHVFERFYRCEPSRSPAGTGLGLSLALAIAKAHGGNIDVSSTLGKGSTFAMTLPKDSA